MLLPFVIHLHYVRITKLAISICLMNFACLPFFKLQSLSTFDERALIYSVEVSCCYDYFLDYYWMVV